jgi:hypothetical protein
MGAHSGWAAGLDPMADWSAQPDEGTVAPRRWVCPACPAQGELTGTAQQERAAFTLHAAQCAQLAHLATAQRAQGEPVHLLVLDEGAWLLDAVRPPTAAALCAQIIARGRTPGVFLPDLHTPAPAQVGVHTPDGDTMHTPAQPDLPTLDAQPPATPRPVRTRRAYATLLRGVRWALVAALVLLLLCVAYGYGTGTTADDAHVLGAVGGLVFLWALAETFASGMTGARRGLVLRDFERAGWLLVGSLALSAGSTLLTPRPFSGGYGPGSLVWVTGVVGIAALAAWLPWLDARPGPAEAVADSTGVGA